MNMQESKHCFSTLNPPNTFRYKGVLQNGAEKGLNPAKSLISSCKVILSGWQLQAFQCIYSSCLAANEAETRISSSDLPYGGGILPWPQISLMGVATLDSQPEMGICGYLLHVIDRRLIRTPDYNNHNNLHA